jgi:hypothetical protein
MHIELPDIDRAAVEHEGVLGAGWVLLEIIDQIGASQVDGGHAWIGRLEQPGLLCGIDIDSSVRGQPVVAQQSRPYRGHQCHQRQ